MADPEEVLARLVGDALGAAFGPDCAGADPLIRPSQFADFQANVALSLAKRLNRVPREVAAALRTHAARGRTLFLSIHQISDAGRFCDRFILLSNGRVCGEGTVPELAALATARDASKAYDNLEEVFLALT